MARAVVASRYPEAVFAFAAGSIMRGEGTILSDVDLVVIHDHLEAAWRESFMVDGIPFEVFVHDHETLAWFIRADVERGQPSIVKRLSEGPPALEYDRLNALRYEITDAVDDLRGERGTGEMMAIGAMLHPRLVELALRGRGRWNGTGKWAPRLLADMDANLALQFENAFRALFVSGACGPVIALAEQELEPHGGPLFEGDFRRAPPSWRSR